MSRLSTSARRSEPTFERILDGALPDFASVLTWSPDGRTLAAATLAGTSHVWVRGAWAKLEGAHEGGALAVAFSPDGKTLATAGADGHVHLHDTSSLGRAASVRVGVDWASCLAWAPDGASLAAASGKRVTFLSRAGGVVATTEHHASTVTSIAWGPEGRQLLSTCYGGVHFLVPYKPAPLRTLPWKGSILVAALSPDGRWIATGNQDASVHVWNIASGADLEMSGYPTKVTAIAWAEGGPILATGGGNSITIWNFAGKGPAGSRPVDLTGHRKRVTGLAFAAKGDRLFSVGDDGVFHVAERKPKWRSAFAEATESPLSSLAATTDGRLCAAAGAGGRVVAWRAT
jgi:WD40 repeat protein